MAASLSSGANNSCALASLPAILMGDRHFPAERERRAAELQYEMGMDMFEFQRDVTNGYSDAYGSPHFD
uniref:Uncharacterized protein n=1 Tax=Rubinisphaera brasiliensis (strain ATCC 49424 / DSM 5305 / JCM 21570 / IAM 15109 / NBRC 103401 / IFAM 1448) TaxID=756272 RepID=F0SR37_RUBBR|nr:hypothetical protein Plabr_3687 [Rubinisphaera brasiliensis DSM 5305]